MAGPEDEVFVVSKVVSPPHLAASLPLPPVQPIPVDVVVMHWRHRMLGYTPAYVPWSVPTAAAPWFLMNEPPEQET